MSTTEYTPPPGYTKIRTITGPDNQILRRICETRKRWFKHLPFEHTNPATGRAEWIVFLDECRGVIDRYRDEQLAGIIKPRGRYARKATAMPEQQPELEIKPPEPLESPELRALNAEIALVEILVTLEHIQRAIEDQTRQLIAAWNGSAPSAPFTPEVTVKETEIT